MTKQNMPRLTESQLFTIEALNKIQGFVWPKEAAHASMDAETRVVDFWTAEPRPLQTPSAFDGPDGSLVDNDVYAESKHPDWRGSLITREQFDGVDGWVRHCGNSMPEQADEKRIDYMMRSGHSWGNRSANDLEWNHSCHADDIIKWRYHKPSNADNTETVAMKDPVPYFARRSFSWVGCENGFIIPDRIKEAEFNILGEPVIVILAEVDEILQEQDGSIFRAAHIDINLGEAICNNTNQNITANVIRYLPIDAREVANHEV